MYNLKVVLMENWYGPYRIEYKQREKNSGWSSSCSDMEQVTWEDNEYFY